MIWERMPIRSHPLRVRGLKQKNGTLSDVVDKSHPLRVRGLKLKRNRILLQPTIVASFTGAWIETEYHFRAHMPAQSHPLRVRGLKLSHR